ncbi:alpha/beta fold hydrolase [Sediminispirochaeta bajacaliforniensis]|uniref:alpha/beta fold hydrolase n=1 Tax=Sediminispirochaeta bajacaliforniensis TaxID=148 RepID=UPI000476CB0F|nr:alpha/beta fold hydrolase [Sediminispirochaeta bajacaliforniensis]
MILSHVQYPCSGSPCARCALIIVHGLFGAGINWRRMAEQLSELRDVYTLDLRNHGESDHEDALDYQVMAADVAETCTALRIDQAVFLGHSMGGKVVMQLAFDYSSLVRGLVVADIGPDAYPHRFTTIVEALGSLDLSGIRGRGEADQRLAASIEDRRVRTFLLQNLRRDKDGHFFWRLNLASIRAHLDDIAASVGEGTAPSPLPALFLAGEHSSYLNSEQRKAALALFPLARFAEVPNAGHWVQVDNPDAFFRFVSPFLASLDPSP